MEKQYGNKNGSYDYEDKDKDYGRKNDESDRDKDKDYGRKNDENDRDKDKGKKDKCDCDSKDKDRFEGCKCEDWKNDKKRVKLADCKFELLNEHGKKICCATTNRDGEIFFDDLPLGKYFLKEIDAPCGFEKCHEIFEVKIDCCNQHRTVEVINKKIKGSIKIVKFGVEY